MGSVCAELQRRRAARRGRHREDAHHRREAGRGVRCGRAALVRRFADALRVPAQRGDLGGGRRERQRREIHRGRHAHANPLATARRRQAAAACR